MKYLIALLACSCVKAREPIETPYQEPETIVEVAVEERLPPDTGLVDDFELFSPNLPYCRPGDHNEIDYGAVDSNYYNEWTKEWRWCISDYGVEGNYSYYVVNQAGETLCGYTYRFTGTFREDLTITHWHYAFEIEDSWLHWHDATQNYMMYGICNPSSNIATYWRISPENIRDGIPWELLYSHSAATGVWYPPWYHYNKYDPLYYALQARPAKAPNGDIIMRITYQLMD